MPLSKDKSPYIDPDLEAGLAVMHALTGGNDLTQDLAAARLAANARDEMLLANIERPANIAQGMETASSADGHDIDMRIMQPTQAGEKKVGKKPLFYWIHGGGYVLGQAKQGDIFTLRAAQLGCYAASVEYRLAPETAYPGPLEDCYEGLKHLLDNADALGIDKTRIIIGGVSAGGGLCAGLALLIRDRGLCAPLGQLLIYPMIDDTNIEPASETLPDTPIWSRHYNLFGWRSYLGDLFGTKDIPIYAAPARAENVSGLPPTYMPVGDLDLFLDENIAYARKLTRARVPTHFHIVPGAFHGFNGFVPDAPVSRAINGEIFSYVEKLLADAD
ncbi:MAG: alpha/beta hydrolase [Alphaproteobacteria bacterium]|nr:alpha/beta hydrolase [Alphaproteobacteria bacterium]